MCLHQSSTSETFNSEHPSANRAVVSRLASLLEAKLFRTCQMHSGVGVLQEALDLSTGSPAPANRQAAVPQGAALNEVVVLDDTPPSTPVIPYEPRGAVAASGAQGNVQPGDVRPCAVSAGSAGEFPRLTAQGLSRRVAEGTAAREGRPCVGLQSTACPSEQPGANAAERPEISREGVPATRCPPSDYGIGPNLFKPMTVSESEQRCPAGYIEQSEEEPWHDDYYENFGYGGLSPRTMSASGDAGLAAGDASLNATAESHGERQATASEQ